MDNVLNKQQRVGYLDMLKGLGMFIIVSGHLLKRRSKTLLLPYVMFAILTWLLWAVFSMVTHRHSDVWSSLLQIVVSQGSGDFITFNPPLWFVTCLFVIEI